jgi:hypothetical protein
VSTKIEGRPNKEGHKKEEEPSKYGSQEDRSHGWIMPVTTGIGHD